MRNRAKTHQAGGQRCGRACPAPRSPAPWGRGRRAGGFWGAAGARGGGSPGESIPEDSRQTEEQPETCKEATRGRVWAMPGGEGEDRPRGQGQKPRLSPARPSVPFLPALGTRRANMTQMQAPGGSCRTGLGARHAAWLRDGRTELASGPGCGPGKPSPSRGSHPGQGPRGSGGGPTARLSLAGVPQWGFDPPHHARGRAAAAKGELQPHRGQGHPSQGQGRGWTPTPVPKGRGMGLTPSPGGWRLRNRLNLWSWCSKSQRMGFNSLCRRSKGQGMVLTPAPALQGPGKGLNSQPLTWRAREWVQPQPWCS